VFATRFFSARSSRAAACGSLWSCDHVPGGLSPPDHRLLQTHKHDGPAALASSGAVFVLQRISGGGGTRTPKGLRPPHFECGALPVRLRLLKPTTVGTAGFEPATPRSRSECSTGLSHVPKYCARTYPSLHRRSRADRVGFEPTRAVNPTRFPIVLLKPLGHRSQQERRGRDSNPRLPFGQDGLANRWF
jgi:hypothetical protein